MDSPSCKIYDSFVKLLTKNNPTNIKGNEKILNVGGLIRGVVIKYTSRDDPSKWDEYSCIALERLFNYPSMDISNFGSYDFGKDKIKKFQRLLLADKGVTYEFSCEKIDKLNKDIKLKR